MKRIKIFTFLLIFMCCSVTVFAVKDKEVPPWMEDIKRNGKSTYLIPKGAKNKVIGSQIVVEPPNEYVARRLYEMEGYLERRFKKIEENQENSRKELEELKGAIEELEGLKETIKELKMFRGAVEEGGLKETVEDLMPLKKVVEKLEELEKVVEELKGLRGVIEGLEELKETVGELGEI